MCQTLNVSLKSLDQWVSLDQGNPPPARQWIKVCSRMLYSPFPSEQCAAKHGWSARTRLDFQMLLLTHLVTSWHYICKPRLFRSFARAGLHPGACSGPQSRLQSGHRWKPLGFSGSSTLLNAIWEAMRGLWYATMCFTNPMTFQLHLDFISLEVPLDFSICIPERLHQIFVVFRFDRSQFSF